MSNSEALVKKPWATLGRQREASTFGIWVFLASEVLFFGALLLTYTAYRISDPEAFAAAARETDIFYGTINTAILLTSSLTMAVAAQASAAEQGFRRLVLVCLCLTAALGAGFLIVKGFEYKKDIGDHLIPGPNFALSQPAAQIFFALYWVLTGVHTVHLSIGIVLVSRLAFLIWRRELVFDGNPEIEVTGLYWHLVDIVWIFLYPLIYLPGRASP